MKVKVSDCITIYHVMLALVVTGRECEVVILTTVRSLPEEDIPDHPSYSWVNENLGFVTNKHLINVAITRAKEALCIIGKYGKCIYCIQECTYSYNAYSNG